jgi:hypothetical protein
MGPILEYLAEGEEIEYKDFYDNKEEFKKDDNYSKVADWLRSGKEFSYDEALQTTLCLKNLETLDISAGIADDKIISMSKAREIAEETGMLPGFPRDYISSINGLYGLPALEELNIEGNKLTTTTMHFSELASLKRLDLANNQLSKAFLLPKTLEELYLNNNRILIIQGLSNLKKLKLLDLSNNKKEQTIKNVKVKDINPYLLNDFKKDYKSIKSISLSDYEYHADSFSIGGSHNRFINQLKKKLINKIASNREAMNTEVDIKVIRSISSMEGLEGLENLEVLYLNDNNINWIESLENNKNLMILEISGNPINGINLSTLNSIGRNNVEIITSDKSADMMTFDKDFGAKYEQGKISKFLKGINQ